MRRDQTPRTILWFAAFALLVSACHGGSSSTTTSTQPPPKPTYQSPYESEAERSSYETGESTDSESETDAPGRQMPADHTVNWMQRHGAMALGQGDDCAVCHTEQDCIGCHVESLDEPYSVHPPNYEVVHAVDASQGVQDCTSCHRLDTFCEACHVEAGVSPRLDDSPPSDVDFHPPDWLDPTAPQNHATQARQNIQDCASCHIERDCVSCHRGINPHPPEFRLECGSILQTDPSSCARCHTEDIDVLRQLCI